MPTGHTPKPPAVDLTPSLVLRLRQGDSAAGALLDEIYRQKLIRFCFGYLGDAEAAEDVVQDVFCKVLEDHTIPDNFRAWVYRISRNRCLDVLRTRARKKESHQLPSESQLDAEITGNLTRLVRCEQKARLRHLLAGLPANQREVLRLRYTEDLSRAEIAEVLSIRESVVKSRLFEGVEKLRQHESLEEG